MRFLHLGGGSRAGSGSAAASSSANKVKMHGRRKLAKPEKTKKTKNCKNAKNGQTDLQTVSHSPNKCNFPSIEKAGMQQHPVFPDQKDCNMAYTQTISEQRYCTSKHYRRQLLNQIARTIGCHSYTVSSEIRHQSVNGTYCYRQALQQSNARKKNKTARKMTDTVK